MDDHTQLTSMAAPPSGKFCAITKTVTLDSRLIYNIFIAVVDSSCGEFGMPDPTIELDVGMDDITYSHGFCVMGKTLYIIEGCREKEEDDNISKSVYSIDLSSIEPNTNTKLDISSVLKVGEIGCRIAYPVAIPTPDCEKIVVFSTTPNGLFLLYTPSLGSCERLPSIADHWPPIYDECVGKYGFIDDSVFLVQLNGRGVFTLDFEELNKGWVKCDDELASMMGLVDLPSPFFVVEKGRFCFTIAGVYDLKLGRKSGCFQLSWFDTREPPSVDVAETLHVLDVYNVAPVSNVGGGAVIFGSLRTRLVLGAFTQVFSNFIIDLCCSHGFKAAADDETQSVISKAVKTLKISTVYKNAEWCELMGFFSIPS